MRRVPPDVGAAGGVNPILPEIRHALSMHILHGPKALTQPDRRSVLRQWLRGWSND